MRLARCRRTVLVVLAAVSLLTFPRPSFPLDAEDPPAPQLDGAIRRGHESRFILSDGVSIKGRLLRVDRDQQVLAIRHFDSRAGRFSIERLGMERIAEIRSINRHQTNTHAILGLLAGAGLGAGIGYLAGDDGDNGGDVLYSDQRPLLAAALGGVGALAGLIVGAVTTPSTTSEEVVWSRK